MSDSDYEGIPLFQINTSVRNEEDLDESRETETTDDECLEETAIDGPTTSVLESIIHEPKAGVSYLEQSGTPDNSINSNNSQSSSSSVNDQLVKGREAFSYFAGDILTSSSDSNHVHSLTNSVDLGYVIEYRFDEDGNIDYLDIDFDDSISDKHVAELMNKLRHNHYTAISCEGDFTLSKCRKLFERDYFCKYIENLGGSLSRNYPAQLIIPCARRSQIECFGKLDALDFDLTSYYSKVKRSVYSRLLTRFVVPVILFDKKFICRSGSLTVRKTAVFERARQKEAPKNFEITASAVQQIVRKLAGSLTDFSNRTRKAASQLFFPNSMTELRDIDAEILRDLNIERICDLMVEDRKMYKQTIRISSSEKINRNIFKDCVIEQMPYPGCRFFSRYHEAEYDARGLVYEWDRPDVNVEMQFSVDPNTIFPNTDWANYKNWDVISLTKNYLKMLLSFLVKDSGGMLIHCVSGWDRTPLFISLLRVSLWADGLIHMSLDYRDMAYLTLAYDWYLFGHNFPQRLSKDQEILHFCFNFLVNIATDEFSATRMFHELSADEKTGRLFPDFVPGKRDILKILRIYVMDAYTEYITQIPHLN